MRAAIGIDAAESLAAIRRRSAPDPSLGLPPPVSARELAFDPEDPSADPPQTAHPTLWEVAYIVYRDHRPHTDGWCVVCRTPRQLSPCTARLVAVRGLHAAVAMGREQLAGPLPRRVVREG